MHRCLKLHLVAFNKIPLFMDQMEHCLSIYFFFPVQSITFNASLLRLAETSRDKMASLEQRCQNRCLALLDLQLFSPF